MIKGNSLLLKKLTMVAVVMFAFGYALIPIYKSFCEFTGINVLAVTELNSWTAKQQKITTTNSQIDASREIVVEFDVNARGPWLFRPQERFVTIHPGELRTVMYDFENTQDHEITAQAIPSYAPAHAARHFNKIECFCFQQYTLKPGEKKSWPVTFVIDPKIDRNIRTITLSYTFFKL